MTNHSPLQLLIVELFTTFLILYFAIWKNLRKTVAKLKQENFFK